MLATSERDVQRRVKKSIANTFRIPCALLLIALEFTNLATFLVDGGNSPGTNRHSSYAFQFAAYGIAGLVLLLDREAMRRIIRKPIVRWAFVTLMLLTWAMLVRTFNVPIGYTDYLLLRTFGLQVNSIGLLLTCIIIFDDPYVLQLTKRAVGIATLVGVLLNIYDFIRPGTFSVIYGRAAGLYMQPNSSGMALVFGCLIGLTVVRGRWGREAFLLCTLVGVVVTFSREAVLAFGVVLIAGVWASALSPRRLAVVAGIGIGMFIAFNVAPAINESRILTSDAASRLTLQWSDASAKDRARLAEKTLERFEEAPLMGEGFGTTLYWQDSQSHNAYLELLADCGILGVLVIPGLILSINRGTWDSYAFAIIVILWGFFNHNLLLDFFGLISLAIEADEPNKLQDVGAMAFSNLGYRTS